MGVTVLEAEDADMYRLFEICSLAFARNEPFFDVTWPKHWTEAGRKQGGERFIKIKHADPNAHLLKAVDDSGKIVGFGKWDFYINRLPDSSSKDETDYWGDPEEKAFVDELVKCFLEERNAAIVKRDGNVASLDILAIDPSSQRQGAGHALVKWGLDRADELGLEAIVESSVFGKGLYQKHGFVFQRDVKVTASSERFAGRDGGEFAWFERPKVAKS